MDLHEQENRIKLHILTSLARSQRALATMLENVADVAGTIDISNRLEEQIEAIGSCQRQIADKMIGIKIRKKTRGRSGKLWLHPRLKHLPPTASAKK